MTEVLVDNAGQIHTNDVVSVTKPRNVGVMPVEPFVDETGQLAVGAYTVNNEVFVHADCTDRNRLLDHDVKRLCYEHRLALGMAQAGLDFPNGPHAVDAKDAALIPALVEAPKGGQVYRISFRLNY